MIHPASSLRRPLAKTGFILITLAFAALPALGADSPDAAAAPGPPAEDCATLPGPAGAPDLQQVLAPDLASFFPPRGTEGEGITFALPPLPFLRTCRCSCGAPCLTNSDCGPGGICSPGVTCCARPTERPTSPETQTER